MRRSTPAAAATGAGCHSGQQEVPEPRNRLATIYPSFSRGRIPPQPPRDALAVLLPQAALRQPFRSSLKSGSSCSALLMTEALEGWDPEASQRFFSPFLSTKDRSGMQLRNVSPLEGM